MPGTFLLGALLATSIGRRHSVRLICTAIHAKEQETTNEKCPPIATLLGLLASLSWAASFVLVFKGLTLVGPLALVSLQALVGAVVLGAIAVSRRGPAKFRTDVASAWSRIGAWPVIALAGFYFLQVIRRFTEGQSGTNILFILGLAPVIVLAISARRLAPRRLAFGVAGTAVAVLGTVGILANWERPSSFSPFVLFPREELLLLGAASCWAFFLVLMEKRMRDLDALTAATTTLGVTALMLGLAGLISDGPSSFLIAGAAPLRLVILLGTLGGALGTYAWLALLENRVGAPEAASVSFLAAPLLTLLIFLDQAQGLTGPNPMVIDPVLVGSLLAVLGVLSIWTSGHVSGSDPTPALPTNVPARAHGRMLGRVGLALAAGSVGSALVALWLPVQSSAIEGKTSNGTPFAAQWLTQGYQAAGAWLAVLAAAIAIGVAWRLLKGDVTWWDFVIAAGIAVAALAAAPALSDSLFVAWRSWIPPEIQHGIGTQYVSLTQNRIANPAFLAVDLTVAPALLLLIVKILWKQRKAG